MARNARAIRVKSQLFEIAAKLSGSQDSFVTSRRIVDEFIKSKVAVDEKETAQILDIGLMILAGRIPQARNIDKEIFQIKLEFDVPEYTNVFVKNGNKVEKLLKPTLEIIPNQYFSQTKRENLEKKQSGRTEMEKILNKMKEEGFGDMKYGEYLKRGS